MRYHNGGELTRPYPALLLHSKSVASALEAGDCIHGPHLVSFIRSSYLLEQKAVSSYGVAGRPSSQAANSAGLAVADELQSQFQTHLLEKPEGRLISQRRKFSFRVKNDAFCIDFQRISLES